MGPQCPTDTPVVCKRDTDKEPQGCCPQGQFCITTLSEVYCCPTGKSTPIRIFRVGIALLTLVDLQKQTAARP